MKITTFLKCAFLAASMLWATSFQASAQAPAGGGAGARNTSVLTQEQRAKMRDAYQTELAPLNEKLAAAQKDLVKTALAADAKEEDLKTKMAAVQKLQTELMVLRLKGVKAIAATLTAEQKTQLEGLRDGGYNTLFSGFGGGVGVGGAGRNAGARRNAGGGNN